MIISVFSSFNIQKTLAEQNLEDTRQQLLAARSSQAKAINNLETRVLTSLLCLGGALVPLDDMVVAENSLGSEIFFQRVSLLTSTCRELR